MATINFSESENSVDEFSDEAFNSSPQAENLPKILTSPSSIPQETSFSNVNNKMCYGPDINLPPSRGMPNLPMFVRDVETELNSLSVSQSQSHWPNPKENKFESNNSLDIEKELNDLIGTLRIDIEAEGNANIQTEHVDDDNYNFPVSRGSTASEDIKDGSRFNLAFIDTECESDKKDSSDYVATCSLNQIPVINSEEYWKNQRIKSKSFADRYKLGKMLKRGKQRMSMIEYGSKIKGCQISEPDDVRLYSTANGDRDNDNSNVLGLAYDRSSVVDPVVSSSISLPIRPRSEPDDSRRCIYPSQSCVGKHLNQCSPSNNSGKRTESFSNQANTSDVFDDCIDWTWLEDAIKNFVPEAEGSSVDKNLSSRVDAGCQTQSDQSWQGEERMCSRAPSPRVSDSAIDVTSECRVAEIEVSNDNMPRKAIVESNGSSGVSGWLRQSMRRVRHFNLEDPTRIRSAPPDCLRNPVESVESEAGVNQVNNVDDNVQQRTRSEDPRTQRRRLSRARPSSAPARRSVSETALIQQQQQQEAETTSTTPSSEAQDNLGYESDSADRHPSPGGRRQQQTDDDFEECGTRSPLGSWPHSLSSIFASLGCTLGLFNISRFAVLSVHFGSSFILQFLILSLVFGIPLLAFHAALGQTLGAGPVDMWKISPLFQGIGIALLLAQALIGMYSIVGVSWMFVYFRDSFITKQDTFSWAEPFRHYRGDNIFTSILNTSGRLEESVPDYLNVVVLQRHGLTSPENAFGHLKFQLTFNLAVVWMIVFVSLSKGLRSYGKVVYVFSVVPVLGVLVLCSKLLGLTPLYRGFFPQTEWSEFFLNPKSWISAATEVMLTWNLLGAAVMQVTSHNRSNKRLWRDIATITLLTLVVLILVAFLGNMCHQLILLKGYSYVPSSFERISTYSFLRPSGAPLSPTYAIPTRHMPHASLVAGDRVGKPGAIHESGYQVIRLATELVPATLAILDGNYLSPFWAVLFYFTLILFGIAQQLAIWHCVITGIMAINASTLKSWETTITFFTCAAGFILGLPMTTELGIFVVYFLDYCLGGGWWVILLTMMEICAVLMVRGRPYSGENISIALFGKATSCLSLWAVPLLTFIWNVIMPVALLVMSIIIFKSGGYRDLWIWKSGKGDYWPLWTRQVGVFVQIIPLFCIPIVGLVQCYRYLLRGPADVFDRLTNLFRPNVGISGIANVDSTTATTNDVPTEVGINGTTEIPQVEDPPPKYTPPPSYSTVTGTRIAKLLRHSFRRSIRRIQTVLGPDTVQASRPPPPDYASVLVEMNQNRDENRENSLPSRTNTFTAADVAQVLRCSFRRNNVLNTNLQGRTTNASASSSSPPPQNLVNSPHQNE